MMDVIEDILDFVKIHGEIGISYEGLIFTVYVKNGHKSVIFCSDSAYDIKKYLLKMIGLKWISIKKLMKDFSISDENISKHVKELEECILRE